MNNLESISEQARKDLSARDEAREKMLPLCRDSIRYSSDAIRAVHRQDFEKAFKNVDVLATPITPTPPFKIGEMSDDPLAMYLGDVYTLPVNLAGVAGISIPCGFTREGLPIGLQLIGGHFEEEKVLRVAYAFQENTDFHKKQAEVL